MGKTLPTSVADSLAKEEPVDAASLGHGATAAPPSATTSDRSAVSPLRQDPPPAERARLRRVR